jgi:chemotaxis protein methyltransferase CheR
MTRATRDREFSFETRDFARVRRLIHERVGISLSEAKQDMVYGRLSRRLRALHTDSFRCYLDSLEAAPDSPEWQNFVNALTTNLTAFFREPHHFDTLKSHLAGLPRGRPVTLWCAAASTGEEPYSIAMACAEHYGSLRPPVRILATDVDTEALQKAARGVYAADRIGDLDATRRKAFFLRGTGPNTGQVRVRPALSKLITYRQLNLVDQAWPVRGSVDVIFCRNVMIYFDKPTQAAILRQFHPRLVSGGLLIAGHSESYLNLPELFTPRGQTVYARVDGGAAAGVAA